MNAKSITVYQCTQCQSHYHLELSAEKCCQEKTPTTPIKALCHCGKEKEYSHHTLCESCKMEKTYQEAEKVHIDDYKGWVYDPVSDKYFQEIEEFYEYWYEKEQENKEPNNNEPLALPKYLHQCYEVPFKIDINHAIDNAMDDMYEDADTDDLIDLGELEEYVEKWNEKQTLCSIDYYSKKIVIGLRKDW